MTVSRAALFAAAALLVTGGEALAQAAPASRPLPAGLRQSGGVVMMQPVDSSENGGEAMPASTADRHPSAVHSLSAADHDLYTKAFDAADRGDWIAARGLADQGRDPTARLLVTWRYLLDRNSGASFGEIDAFLRAHPDWPMRQTLFARAEKAMAPTMAPGAVLAWFGDRKPNTGIGKVRLGEALLATGNREQGRELIRNAWIEDNFEPADELAIVRAHGDILTPDIDRRRLDRLLWQGDLAAARRQLSRVGAQAQRVAEVRMALRTNPRAGERMEAGLPDTLKRDPGIIFDRARVMRRAGGGADVPELLVKAPTRELAKIDAGDWWNELNIAAREAMKGGSYRTAYRLVSDTGLRDGTDFAEAEFMAGWIALRFLKDPRSALTHFQRLADGVGRPISRARANYWSGRAYEAADDDAAAAGAYRLAAKDADTFYGQLALAKLEPAPKLHLKDTAADPARDRASYEGSDLTRAMRVLADLGTESLLRTFAVHAADTHTDAGYLTLLAGDLVRMGFPEIAVRAAKIASYNGVRLLPYSHPVIALPRYPGPGTAPENALVLGLIRQETEFRNDAVSRVGAVGIMQLMPATAKRMAQLAGLPYRHADLRTDTSYNIQLGMTELSGDLSDWGGSYVLAAAAYNAGPTNVKRWIQTYGDPRDPGIDPIDWIEQIPFSETRNYVQRVIENTEVYRNRLSGRSEPLQILADLYRPKAPDVAVLKFVPPAGAEPAAPGTVPVPQARPQQAGVQAPKADDAAAGERETAALVPARAIAGEAVPRPDARPKNAPGMTPSPRPAQIPVPGEKPAR